MNALPLKAYRVAFAGGITKTVKGRYAAHALAWAQHCNPGLKVLSLEQIETAETEQEP